MDESKKIGRYTRILSQLEILLTKTDNPIARMATIAAILIHKLDYYFWCGFYIVADDKLIVGPYQGPVACQILQNNGVCISCMKTGKSIIVPDVNLFPGHISCDTRSKSEIVIPIYNKNNVVEAVLDVDSSVLNAFDETDKHFLEIIAAMIYKPL